MPRVNVSKHTRSKAVEILSDVLSEHRATPSTGDISEAFNLLKREDAPCLSTREIGEIAACGWAGENDGGDGR